MIDMDCFTENFMEMYSFKPQQEGKKCCKYCRYYKAKLSKKEIEDIKEYVDFFTENLGTSEFGICKIASKMALKVIEREEERSPIITAYSGHCELFKLSILKIIIDRSKK